MLRDIRDPLGEPLSMFKAFRFSGPLPEHLRTGDLMMRSLGPSVPPVAAPVFQRRTEYSERSEFCRTGFNDAGFSMLFMDWLAGDL